jgi:hypothetical protein
MHAKRIVVLALQIIALTILLSISFMIGPIVSGMAHPENTAAPAGAPSTPAPAAAAISPNTFLLWLLVASFFQAVVVTYLILRSRWSGWKVIGAVFLIFFNTHLQAAIETAVYLSHRVPSGMIRQLPVSGAVLAGIFSPLAVLLLGKMRRQEAPEDSAPRWEVTAGDWILKFAAIGAVYLMLYYSFGYLVAWQSPLVRQYYHGESQLLSFPGQLSWIWSTTPWMFPLQAFRAILWAALTIPLARMLKGGPRDVALGMALAYAVLGGSALLLLPNPLMPLAIARVHLVETASSNFLFGGFVGWLLTGGTFSPRLQSQPPVAR